MPHVRLAFRRPCRALLARVGLVSVGALVAIAWSGCSGCEGPGGCGDPATSTVEVIGSGEPTASPPPTLDPACEPSGGATIGDTIWIADDETRLLTGYLQQGAAVVPMFQVELPTGARPEDVEALAADGNVIYAVGSHALVRGEFDDDRARIQVLRLEHAAAPVRDDDDDDDTHRVVMPVRLGSIVSPDLRDTAACREAIDGPQRDLLCAAIHEQGLEIEGAVFLAGGLFVGLRAPLLSAAPGLDPRAVVLHVDTTSLATREEVPSEGSAGGQRPLRATIAATLDLGGRGIRSLSRHGRATLIVAGPSDDGRTPHALYEVGSDPARWETVPTRLSMDAPAGTEALVTTPARATWAFIDGGRCSASGARRLTL